MTKIDNGPFPKCLILFVTTLHSSFLPPAIRRMAEGYIFSLSTFRKGGGGPRSQIFLGGVGGGGGPRSQIFLGPRSQIFLGGSQVSDFSGRCHRSQIFWGGGPGLSKGKIFDTRFGLIHIQTRKKIFCQGTPTPSKGKNF